MAVIIPPANAVERLHSFADAPDTEIDLGLTLLWLSRLEYPHLDIGEYLRRLDVLAGQFEARIHVRMDEADKIRELSRFMSAECGFRGNSEDFYDPRNSFLNDVMDRHTGIPITLSAIYIEVAKRVGLNLRGIGFPFHFLVGAASTPDIYVDAFHGGRMMDHAACRELLTHITDGRLPWQQAFLEPVSVREMVVRTFRNLKNIYARNLELEDAICMSGLILAWLPNETIEYRDRGLMRLEMRDLTRGIDDLQNYIARSPNAPDHEMVLAELQQAHRVRGMLN